jgi:hypothetical protein
MPELGLSEDVFADAPPSGDEPVYESADPGFEGEATSLSVDAEVEEAVAEAPAAPEDEASAAPEDEASAAPEDEASAAPEATAEEAPAADEAPAEEE